MKIKLTNKFHKTEAFINAKDNKISGISAKRAFNKLCPNFRKNCKCKYDCGEYALRADTFFNNKKHTVYRLWKEFEIDNKKFVRFTTMTQLIPYKVFSFCLDENGDIFEIQWERKDMGSYDEFTNPKIIKKYENKYGRIESFQDEYGELE